MYDAVLSRAGVLKYLNTDGTWRFEYRPPSEVFSVESMHSFDGMALTDDHPNGVPVDAQNRTKLGRGYIVPGSLRRDGNNLVGTIHVTDAGLLTAIKAGRTAVSLGYFQDRVRESGVSTEDGQAYTYKQTNVRGNHVAIVDVARAGDVARLQVDSITTYAGDEIMELKEALNKILQLEIDAGKNKLRLDALEAENPTIRKALSTVEAERDTLKDKLDKSEKLRIDSADKALAAARATVQLENTATKILTVDGVVPKLGGMTDRQIREAVIVKLSGKQIPVGKDDSYIEARFDHLIEDSASRDSNDNRNARAVLSVITADRDPSPKDLPLSDVLNEDGTYNESKIEKLSSAQMQKLNAARDANAWRKSSAK